MFFDADIQEDKQSILAFDLSKKPKGAPAPIDPFELKLVPRQYSYFTDDELVAAAGGTMIFDCESFSNYFLVGFKSVEVGKLVQFEASESETLNLPKLRWMLTNFCIVGFNSKEYDILILQHALQGATVEEINDLSLSITVGNSRSFDIAKSLKFEFLPINHIDLINVAPLKGSLKVYAGRLHCQRMQELPIDYRKALTPEEIEKVKDYNCNDLDNSELLFNELKPQLKLREEMSKAYGQDLRSRSDAQIAEYVLSGELAKITGVKPERPSVPPGKVYYYRKPRFIQYASPLLNRMLDTVTKARFELDDSGKTKLPEELKELKLNIAGNIYRMGIGGLHSSEKAVSHIIDDETLLMDADVASYYPSIILNEMLYPKHLGMRFLNVYRTIVDKRLKAKHDGDKVVADSLKITINGSFGKLGSQYSVLFAPDLMIQVTVTGQLALLMLIEILEYHGIHVVSANTDGVLIKCPKSRKAEAQACVKMWEKFTGFETETKEYSAVYMRDVNNYVAIPLDGEVKVKGSYAEKGSSGNTILSKNPETLICNDALIAFLKDDKSIAETIRNCKDITRFVTIRRVTDGAGKSGVYLGKVIRWYYSINCKGEINNWVNGDKVPNSDGAMPLMELPRELPVDIDYDWYIRRTEEMVREVGAGTPIAATEQNGTLF